jgi:hypothetical protein
MEYIACGHGGNSLPLSAMGFGLWMEVVSMAVEAVAVEEAPIAVEVAADGVVPISGFVVAGAVEVVGPLVAVASIVEMVESGIVG